MSHKKILVVDDDPDLLFLVAHGVKSLSPNYQVSTASDGPSALNQLKRDPFDLVVTDYMMPDMTGVELIEAAHRIAPNARFILMTAHHDTHRLRDEIDTERLGGFIGKPFTMPDLLGVVEQVMMDTEKLEERIPGRTGSTSGEPLPGDEVQEQICSLHRKTGAHNILLINAKGRPIYGTGPIDRGKASRLGSFVASNFLAIVELATLFGDNESVFTSSYYQGNKYNIYAYDINGDYFLALVIGAGGKPGTVWFYTKQTAEALADLLPTSKPKQSEADENELSQDFDDILGK